MPVPTREGGLRFRDLRRGPPRVRGIARRNSDSLISRTPAVPRDAAGGSPSDLASGASTCSLGQESAPSGLVQEAAHPAGAEPVPFREPYDRPGSPRLDLDLILGCEPCVVEVGSERHASTVSARSSPQEHLEVVSGLGVSGKVFLGALLEDGELGSLMQTLKQPGRDAPVGDLPMASRSDMCFTLDWLSALLCPDRAQVPAVLG